jgi:hypothetical protein
MVYSWSTLSACYWAQASAFPSGWLLGEPQASAVLTQLGPSMISIMISTLCVDEVETKSSNEKLLFVSTSGGNGAGCPRRF